LNEEHFHTSLNHSINKKILLYNISSLNVILWGSMTVHVHAYLYTKQTKL
jgi:hypothetical protein